MLNEANTDSRNGAVATTQDVLAQHLSCVAKGDLSGMMADYAPESRFFTPDGVQKVYRADWHRREFLGHSIHALAAAASEPFLTTGLRAYFRSRCWG